MLSAETSTSSKIGTFLSSFTKPGSEKQNASTVTAYREEPPGSLKFA